MRFQKNVCFLRRFFTGNKFSVDSGCDTVGRAVASNFRGTRFECSHMQKFKLNMHWNEENKENEAENGPFLKRLCEPIFEDKNISNLPIVNISAEKQIKMKLPLAGFEPRLQRLASRTQPTQMSKTFMTKRSTLKLFH